MNEPSTQVYESHRHKAALGENYKWKHLKCFFMNFEKLTNIY